MSTMYSSLLKNFNGKTKAFNLFMITVVTLSFLICISFCIMYIRIGLVNQVPDLQQNKNNSLKLVCYYVFPIGEMDLQPEGIPAELCTHINLAFVGINQTDFSVHIKPNDLQIIPRLTKLKEKNKNLKIIISVGGSGNGDFSKMVTNHSNRKMFINSTMRLLKKHNLDGVDIDWEWPSRDGKNIEKVKFIQLLQEIRTEFDRHKKHFILSAAVGAIIAQINIYYYAHYISQYVDYINLMTYDYHFFESYYPVTDYNAPMYPSGKDKDTVLSNLNVNSSVYYWASLSMPWDKIIMGLPTFGHTYTLVSSLNHGVHAPASGFGSVGENGFIRYHDVCAFLKLLNTFQVVDDDSKVPYAYNNYDWISYDDEDSIQIKAKYIMEKELGGAMVYSLNSEDFAGTCRKDKTKFPLINKVKTVFNGYS